MNCPKSTFAVFFGNRKFFPASLQASARREVSEVLHRLGHRALMLDADLTRHGAVAALKNAGVPILVQAYPDELDKMAPALRRDAFCGKFSITDVYCANMG